MTAADRQRLERILGMLGSSFAGERDNAARAAEALMKRHGLTWADLEASRPEAAPQPAWEPEPPLWRIFRMPDWWLKRELWVIGSAAVAIPLLMMVAHVPFPRGAGSGGENPPIHLVAH